MEIKEFIEQFAEAIEVTNVESLKPETEFHDLEEWGSISVMLLIAFFDEVFDKEITSEDIKKSKTIQELYNYAVA